MNLTRSCLIFLAAVALAACAGDTTNGDATHDATPDAHGELDGVGDNGIQPDVYPDAAASDGPGSDADDPDEQGDWADDLVAEFEPVVFAVVTDLHINGGPQSPIGKNVAALLDKISALQPAPQFVAVTGDLIDTLYEPVESGPGSRIDTIRQLLDGVEAGVEAVLGNHDYYSADSPQFKLVSDREGRDALFKEQLGIEKWHYSTHGGVKFIYLNTMQGDLWDISIGLNGSMGDEQLQWLDGVLSQGGPAVLFMHHPPSIVLEEGESNLDKLMEKHAQSILCIFAGHLHLWVRSEKYGIPIYLTAAGYEGSAVHHVRVDGAKGSVEILNEAQIDYGDPPAPECDPAQEPALVDATPLEGALLELLISDATAEPAGFGTYLEEAVKMVPFVIRTGTIDPSGHSLGAHLAMGAWVGSSAPGTPQYVDALADGPCLELPLLLNSPCFESSPVSVTFDLAKSLGIGLPAGHKIRVVLRDLSFQGALSGKPSFEKGLMQAKVDLSQGVEDLQRLVVEQYCAGKISTCQPGTGTLPACPASPGVEFFPEIPTKCDVKVGSIGLRMVLGMMKTVPDYMASMSAHFVTWNATSSSTVSGGAVDPQLFGCVQ